MCLWLGEGEVAFECRARLALGLCSNNRSPLANLPPCPFVQRFGDMERWEQEFFGWAIFGKSHEVLRDTFLVVVLHVVTVKRFLKIFSLGFWLPLIGSCSCQGKALIGLAIPISCWIWMLLPELTAKCCSSSCFFYKLKLDRI